MHAQKSHVVCMSLYVRPYRYFAVRMYILVYASVSRYVDNGPILVQKPNLSSLCKAQYFGKKHNILKHIGGEQYLVWQSQLKKCYFLIATSTIK